MMEELSAKQQNFATVVNYLTIKSFKYSTMGKGDKKTKKGKIIMGSYGKKRPHKLEKPSKTTEESKTTVEATT